jgi:hypothetical protein
MADRARFRKTCKMNVKNVCMVALLMFVATSIAVLVAKSLRQPTPNVAILNHRDRLIVCYFHGTAICPACKNIGDYAFEAVTAGFMPEIADGRIEWEKLNFERPENRQFAKDFGLVAPCVVLVEMRGGVRKRWKSLPEVWDLVSDKPAFIAFIRKEIRAFLDEK